MNFDDIGLQIPDVLLPKPGISLPNWAVVACDQFSSQPEYWQQVADQIETSASTGHVIFPEAWLDKGRDDEIIGNIQTNMVKYLEDEVFENHENSLVRCVRTLANGKKRKGVMVALDLECYSYERGVQTLIRATEGTIVDRLPPRIRIRENAPLEFPHIMVLIDDPERTVIEPLFDLPAKAAYDFDLMQGGGHLTGAMIQDEKEIENFADSLRKLANPERFQSTYQTQSQHEPLLYAMGDGNHSFATAKAIWETMKKEQGFEAVADHPARYALVELVNLYDESLEFEAIHRVVFNTQPEQMLEAFKEFYKDCDIEIAEIDKEVTGNQHKIPFFYSDKEGAVIVGKPTQQLATGTLQIFLDEYLKDKSGSTLDYIHGDDTTKELGTQSDNIGFLLPPISKDSLFKTVIFDGALPRKTFSMGDAEDKRYYLEGRKIQK